MSIRNAIARLDETERCLDLLAAEIADERIDAERVSWLGVMIRDYERLLRLEDAARAAIEYGETTQEMAEWSSGRVVAPDLFDAMRSALADPDPAATSEMLREMWGMYAGLVKIHGEPFAGECSETTTDPDLPL